MDQCKCKASDVLRAARRALMEHGPCETYFGVCAAVFKGAISLILAEPPEFEYEDIDYASARVALRIGDLLGNSRWLTSWLVQNKHATRKEIDTAKGRDKLLQTRLAWVDDMIRYFEKQGD